MNPLLSPFLLLLVVIPGVSSGPSPGGVRDAAPASVTPVGALADVLDGLRGSHEAVFELRTWTLESSADGVCGDLAAVACSLVDEAIGGGEVTFTRGRTFVDQVTGAGAADESLSAMRALVLDAVRDGDALTAMEVDGLRVASLSAGDRVFDYQSGVDRIRMSPRHAASPRGLVDFSRLIAPLSLHPESVEWLRGEAWVPEERAGGGGDVHRWSRAVEGETSGTLRLAFHVGDRWPASVLDRITTPLGQDAGAVLTLFRTTGWGFGLEDPKLLEVVRLDTFEREGAVRLTHAVVHRLARAPDVGVAGPLRLPVRFTERTQVVDATGGGPPRFLGSDVETWPEEVLSLLLSE